MTCEVYSYRGILTPVGAKNASLQDPADMDDAAAMDFLFSELLLLCFLPSRSIISIGVGGSGLGAAVLAYQKRKKYMEILSKEEKKNNSSITSSPFPHLQLSVWYPHLGAAAKQHPLMKSAVVLMGWSTLGY